MPSRFEIFRDQIRKNITNRLRLYSAYRMTFETPDGQLVLAHLLRTSNVTRSSFHADPYMNAYNSGKRDAVLQILRFINSDPDSLTRQLEESMENENETIT